MPNMWTKLSFPRQAGTFLLFLLGLLQCRQAAPAVAEADNERPFAAVCGLLQVAEGQLPQNVDVPTANTETAELAAINMTLAPEKWRKQFIKNDYEKQSWQAAKEAGNNPHDSWKANWDKWQQAAIATKPGTATANKIKEAGFTNLPEEIRLHQQMKLAKASAKVEHLEGLRQAAAQQLAGTANAELEKKMNEALYGVDSGQGSFGADSGVSDGTQNKDACNADGTINGKQPLAYTLMCLCLENTQSTTKVCKKGQDINAQWDNIAGDVKTTFDKVRALCPSGKKATVTAASIRSAVQQVYANIHVNANVGYLGGYTGTGCTATTATGICVRYNTKINGPKNEFGTLTFVKNMLDVADALDKRQAAATTIATLTNAIKAEIAALWLQAKEAAALQKLTAKVTSPTTEAAPTLNKKKQECEEQKTNATCKEKGCNWTSTDKTDGDYCRNANGEATTAAGKADGAAATNTETKKCSDKKKEEKCKDGCKWEGTECKDSSCLVNTKLELSMTAAFTVLVAFYHSNDF